MPRFQRLRPSVPPLPPRASPVGAAPAGTNHLADAPPIEVAINSELRTPFLLALRHLLLDRPSVDCSRWSRCSKAVLIVPHTVVADWLAVGRGHKTPLNKRIDSASGIDAVTQHYAKQAPTRGDQSTGGAFAPLARGLRQATYGEA